MGVSGGSDTSMDTHSVTRFGRHFEGKHKVVEGHVLDVLAVLTKPHYKGDTDASSPVV